MTQLETEATKRDAGLARSIGTVAFAATLVNGVIGGGIFAAPAALAGSVGAWAPLALLACGFAMGAIILCCAEAGSRVPSSGGIYAYVEAAFGRGWGFVTGMVLWISCVLAAAGVAAAFADAIVALFPFGPPGVQRVLLLLGVMSLIVGVNLRGARLGARTAAMFSVRSCPISSGGTSSARSPARWPSCSSRRASAPGPRPRSATWCTTTPSRGCPTVCASARRWTAPSRGRAEGSPSPCSASTWTTSRPSTTP